MFIATQIFWLVIIAVVVASIAWTFTQEEIFKELREFCADRCEPERNILVRKFFYVWTCEYCFSHWVTILALLLTGFKLLIDDWRGYVLAFFAIPWLANQLMSIYRLIRVDIKHENALAEKAVEDIEVAAEAK
ncbi:MAG: hypothetical protein ABI878_01350 [Acidobacteriota bacterium]